ncbi:class I SAM-dependent methyltransferase [Rhodanobacter sp. C01]|uniref:class I SAM-dependent methyltransferase n=1 Tax=Rhodanobacter sp. C01 TaxID=1945856 RepID=UPI00098598DF|nr:class I SAM-dependent methyltransferase [Rhodanobacter sp. C01]OOG48537.1 hypothetical protein B0E50_08000 [Rhodanobacter sp. C01]
MSNYWKDLYDTNADKFTDSPLKQVGRTINGAEEGASQIELTIETVRQVLRLDETDRVVDLCCGNGLITEVIASGVASVIGVDFSEKLIEHARRRGVASNVQYLTRDVSALEPSFFAEANKVCMLVSVQHLNSSEVSRLLRTLAESPSIEAVFIASVPDADRLSAFYDDERKMAYYLEREAEGRPHMGTWWSQQQIQALVEEVGLRVRFLAQHTGLTSAYYRYDCLIERPG